MSISLVIVILAIALLVWIGLKYATPSGSAILPDDPLWASAVQQAQATSLEMREHHENGHDVWVKFPLRTKTGSTEHVWGRVAAIRGDSIQCSIETPPAAMPPGTSFGMTEIRLSEIEDWQVELADGKIRGGFTTRAQAEIARRNGQPVPSHVEDMIRRMVE